MKYSVIIPAFNCESTLEATVNSALNSGLSDFEIIIVNDGSKDNTKEICDRLAQDHKEIICIHKENGGVSSARNRGIDEAKGEYMLFMDSDDAYKNGGFTKSCKLIDSSDCDLLIFGLCFDYYKDGLVYRSDELIYPREGLLTPRQWSDDFTALFQSNALSSACNKIFKTRIVKENGIRFDKNVFLMEDFLFVLSYLKHTENILFVKEALYRYRQPDDEMRVYTRMNRIAEINDYIQPFCSEVENLSAALKETYNLSFIQGGKVLFELYKMFVSQKAYYADVDTLKILSKTVRNGRFADFDTDDILINDLKNENYKAIIQRHKKIRLRHKIAVTVKKTALYQKLLGNR